MKKTSKLFGAVALSAALALGTAVPAFAAPSAGGEEKGLNTFTTPNPTAGEGSTYTGSDGQSHTYGTNGTQDITKKDTANTKVNVYTRIDQINVAVPMQITVIAPTEGGNLFVPSSGLKKYTTSGSSATYSNTTGYRIENYSSVAVDITKIEAAAVPGSNWKLKTVAQVNDALGATDIGNIALTLAPAPAASDGNGVNEGNQNPSGTTDEIDVADATAASAPNWTVKGTMSDTEPSILGIKVGGKSSKLQNIKNSSLLEGILSDSNGQEYATVVTNKPASGGKATGKTADHIVNITYTIAANTK